LLKFNLFKTINCKQAKEGPPFLQTAGTKATNIHDMQRYLEKWCSYSLHNEERPLDVFSILLNDRGGVKNLLLKITGESKTKSTHPAARLIVKNVD
jgi:hypothetical protein